MDSSSRAATDVGKLALEEVSFRKRVWDFLSALLRSDAPTSLKALTLLIAALFVLMSFEFSMMLVEVLLCIVLKTSMSFAAYRYTFFGESFLAVFTGFPLVLRMDSVQHAKRLQSDFTEIQTVKRRRRQKVAEGAS